MIRCGDCKHWNTSGWGSVAGTPIGHGQCELISGSEYDADAKAKTANGYDLFTKPDFGCTLGEKKLP